MSVIEKYGATEVFVGRDHCPSCDYDFTRGMPAGFSRAIGLYDRDRDKTVAWRCPDCGHEWKRT